MDISPSGGGSISYSDTGCYSDGTPFLKEKRIGTPAYDIAHIPTSGVDGTGSINYGYRTQKISFTIVYVGNSENAILSDQADDSLSMANGPSTISFSGLSFKRCFLDSFEAKLTPKSTGLGDGLFWQEVEISFTSRGL